MICFFNSCKAWGGGEKWHFEMALRLMNMGYHVIICTWPDSALYKEAKSSGIPVYTFKVSNLSFLNPLKYFKLKHFFIGKKVTHLILNLSSDLKLAGIAAKKAHVTDIIYRRGSAIPIRNTLLNRYLFRKVITRVLTNSGETKRTILARNDSLISSERISVIYNGINLDTFDAQQVQMEKRENQEIILGNLGRLEKQKNQLFLLDVMDKLVTKGYKVKLRIGGAGRLKEEIEKEIEHRGLTKYVELSGFVKDSKSFMYNIDIFVLSSLWEGFGYVLVEAHACSRPVVAFKVSSNPEIVIHRENGLLVPLNDVDGFANAVIELIDSPELRQKMGYNGRKRTEQMFNINTTTKHFVDFLHSDSTEDIEKR